MYPLSQHIGIAADMARACATRLTGEDIPQYENDEATFADYQARIAKSIVFVQGSDNGQIANSLRPTYLDKALRQRSRVYGAGLLIGCHHPAFLFPCHHRLRHPPASWC